VGERQLVVFKDIVRPAYFVPTSMRAVDLLRALQKRHEHLAIVVDEYGGTAGLCTTEDLVEEIVGEIFSEDATAPEMIKPGPMGTSLVSAILPVREFNRAFHADLPEGQGFDTLAGMLTHLAGAIPAVGQSFVAHGFEFTVTERSERRVKQVKVTPQPAVPPT
jgi:putative hemolysin